jgi:hypothetical protein
MHDVIISVPAMRQQLEEDLPFLVLRIFQIKHRMHSSSYAVLAKSLGQLMYSIYDHEKHYTLTRYMVDRALFEALVEQVTNLERA